MRVIVNVIQVIKRQTVVCMWIIYITLLETHEIYYASI